MDTYSAGMSMGRYLLRRAAGFVFVLAVAIFVIVKDSIV